MTDPGGAPPLGVWQLAWPSMTLFGLHALVGVVDLLFVSSLGTQAVAAVGAAVQIHFMVFALLAAVSTGTVALVARATGAGRADDVSQVTRVSVLLSAVVAAAPMALMPFTADLLTAMEMEPAVADLGGRCLRVLLAANIPFAVGATLSMALRGAGDVRTPLAIGILGNIVNLVADYALIFGNLGAPELGAVGSSVASGLAFVVDALLVVALWWRGMLVIRPGAHRPGTRWGTSRRILRIGIPTALEQLTFNGGMLVFITLVATFGTEAVSAYLIGIRILSFCFVPGFGFAMAASTLVGQNLGADRPRQAAASGWRAAGAAVGVMGSVGLVIVLLAGPLAGWFGASGETTVTLTIAFIYILGAAQPLMAVEFALGGALRGAGDTRFPLFAILVGLFVFRLGGAFLIANPIFGTVTAVWCCLLADWGVKAALLSVRFASGRWQHVKV